MTEMVTISISVTCSSKYFCKYFSATVSLKSGMNYQLTPISPVLIHSSAHLMQSKVKYTYICIAHYAKRL